MKHLLALVTCFGLLGSVAAQAQDMKKISIATGADVGFSHLVVAAKKGFLEKYGIQADYRAFDDGSVALDALLTGNADVGMTTSLGGLSRRAKGGKLYVVSAGPTSAVNVGVVVKGDISRPKDFEGKTVGFPIGTSGQEFFLTYAGKYGLDKSKIKQVILPAPESVGALRRGDIDALFIFEPWLERAVKEVPGTKLLVRSGEDNVYTQWNYTYFGEKLVNDKELGAKVIRGIVDAIAWMKNNPEETAQLGATTFRVPIEDARRQLARFEFDMKFPREVRSNMLTAAQLLKDIKVIEQTPNLDEYLRPEMLKAAFPDRVAQ